MRLDRRKRLSAGQVTCAMRLDRRHDQFKGMLVRPCLNHVTSMLAGLGDLEVLLPRLGLGVLRELQSLVCEERVAEAERERGAIEVHVQERTWHVPLLPLPAIDQPLARGVLLLPRALLRVWAVARLPVHLTFARRRAGVHACVCRESVVCSQYLSVI